MKSLPLVFLILIGLVTYQLSPNDYVETKVTCNNQSITVYKNTRLFVTTWLNANGDSFSKLPDYCKETR